MNWLLDVGLFALLFFLLVFVHELGHFLMAKWVGIRVERFSIGMGPQIFAFDWGETKYRIGVLPLGGYVKMAGDDPSKEYSEEEKEFGFLAQKPPSKLLVVFGGPAFNLIFPIFIYSFMLMIGIPTMESYVGEVEEDYPAIEANLLSGDRIVRINGQRVREFEAVQEIIADSPGRELQLEVERLNLETGEPEVIQTSITPRLGPGQSRFGEEVQVGQIGVSPTYEVPQIFFEDDNSPIAKAGFERFDEVRAIDGIEIRTQEQFERALELRNDHHEIQLTAQRNDTTVQALVTLPSGDEPVLRRLGLYPIDLVLGRVDPEMPAAHLGLQRGDRLISTDNQELNTWEDFLDYVRGSEGEPIHLVWSRQGEIMEGSLRPEKTTIDDPIMGRDNPLAKEGKYRIGVGPATIFERSHYSEQSWNPLHWIQKGVSETWRFTSLTAQALGKLVIGDLSVSNLGSPIMIYQVTGGTFRTAGGGHEGWIAFMQLLALLSITLGIINLLPVPILDGGHAMFFIIELIRGRPVSVKTMEVASQVGLIMILSLFALVLYNDFNRYFYDLFHPIREWLG